MKCTWIFAFSLVFANIATAQGFKVVDLGPLVPVGINAEGEVAGNVNGAAAVWTASGGTSQLGILPGGTFSIAAGINDLGVVTGTADGAGAVSNLADEIAASGTESCADLVQPFKWTQSGSFVTPESIPSPWEGDWDPCPWTQDYAVAINDKGQVAGSNTELATYQDGFLWNNQSGVSLVGVNFEDRANAINDSGMIAGQETPGPFLDSWSHAYVWSNGTGYDLGTLGGDSWDDWSGATSINDLNVVAGWSGTAPSTFYLPSVIHAVIWNSQTGIRDLGTLPGDQSSTAVKITLNGIVVGMSGNIVQQSGAPQSEYEVEVTGRPFVWTPLTGMTDLNRLLPPGSGWVLNTVADINIWGQVVGTGSYDGATHGFLLTPTVLLGH